MLAHSGGEDLMRIAAYISVQSRLALLPSELTYLELLSDEVPGDCVRSSLPSC
jgi:hypothetical protein